MICLLMKILCVGTVPLGDVFFTGWAIGIRMEWICQRLNLYTFNMFLVFVILAGVFFVDVHVML